MLLSERHTWLAIICLSFALLLKPHDAGFVWLYFLVAPTSARKHAIKALALAALLSLPAVILIHSSSPSWSQELRTNLKTESARGGISDPGPSSDGFERPDGPIDLQVALSRYKNDPHFYNPASYFVVGALLIILLVKVGRSPFTRESAWMALASVAALSMLPVYHRSYDARLLLLVVPACCILWGQRKWRAQALTLTICALTVTSVIPFAILSMHLEPRLRYS